MHQAQWSPERPLPPPVSLASQSHHEKPPEGTCTKRGNPGFSASTRESPRETFFNTSRGQSPLPRSEEHTSELQSPTNLVCRLLLEKKKKETKMGAEEIREKRVDCGLEVNGFA